MMRFLFCALLVGLIPVFASGQSDPQRAYLELFKEHSVRNGFVRAILRDDFWSQLTEDSSLSIEQLSALRAGYDPRAQPRLTAGAAYFTGAEAVRRLRAVDAAPEEILARILEYRIRWLAGDLEEAHFQATDLVTQITAIDLPDSYMTPVLADAAVLSWRRGEAEAAAAFLERARPCAGSECKPNAIADLMQRIRETDRSMPIEKIADALRNSAIEDAANLFTDSATVIVDIDLAHAFAAGQIAAAYDRLLDVASNAESPAEVSAVDRRMMRLIAERLAAADNFLPFQMYRKSIAGNWRRADAETRQSPRAIIEDTSYLNNPVLSFLPGKVASPIALLRFSDRRGDDVVGELLFARRLMVEGETAQAMLSLRALLADAEARGFSAAELHSVWMDLWALGITLGAEALTREAFEVTAECRVDFCEEDLATRFFKDIEALPRWNQSDYAESLNRTQTERLLRETWPDDPLKLADFYETGAGRQSRPMSAARDAELSLSYAESAANIDPNDLVRRATKAMDAQVYAGRYQAALAMADRIAERLINNPALVANGRFWQVRARAAFRVGDDTARQYYERALEAGAPRGLDLDLLDTPYLDLAAKAASRPTVLARIRARQGRYAEASELINTPEVAQQFGGQFLQNLISNIDSSQLTNELVETALAEADPLDLTQPLLRESSELTATLFQIVKYTAENGDEDAIEMLRRAAAIEAPIWDGLWDEPDLESLARLQSTRDSSYDIIRWIISLRDDGNYDGAAFVMRRYAWLARAAIANGSYTDAQTLWQMAFTFARVGETGIAFDLMDEAASIAATLSFKNAEGSDGGSLQLLERDRWRYLLFVDIAWAAASGKAPQDMLVVSRY